MQGLLEGAKKQDEVHSTAPKAVVPMQRTRQNLSSSEASVINKIAAVFLCCHPLCPVW